MSDPWEWHVFNLRWVATRATARAERRRKTADALMYGTRRRDRANRLEAEAWALVSCLWAQYTDARRDEDRPQATAELDPRSVAELCTIFGHRWDSAAVQAVCGDCGEARITTPETA